MVLVMGRRQLRVVVRPKKIRYGPGSACAVLSQVQRADFAAFVKILMTAQRDLSRREVSREEASQQSTKGDTQIKDQKIKGSSNRGSFVFIRLLQKFMDGFANYLSFEQYNLRW